MPMDGFTLSFIMKELSDKLVGGRIDKVSRPERDTLLLGVRSQNENHRLLLCANVNNARIQLTSQSYENPADAPLFCMLARKHLMGARLLTLEQLGGDRIAHIAVEGMGELGDKVIKHIYLEIMGRYSNLVLVGVDGVVLDAIKHVNNDMSRVRTVLPGGEYHLPPSQDKLCPDEVTSDELIKRLSALSCKADKGLIETISGMASVAAREACLQIGIEASAVCSSVDWQSAAPKLVQYCVTRTDRLSPVTLYDAASLALDFFPFPYLGYDRSLQKPMPTMGEAMDAFYLGRDMHLRVQQRSQSLQKLIKNAIERQEKKKALFLETIQNSHKTEQYRIYGELLTANLHQLGKGQESATLVNYYDENQAQVVIPLSSQLTPAKNAQNYYKKYRKGVLAEQYAKEQLGALESELELLENALDDLDKCVSTTDLAEIRYLLTERGYVRPDPSQKKKKKLLEGKPYRFTAVDGTVIEVGKNALQNDRLTLHARGNETWLHAQKIPGSHVIIRTENEPSDETLLKAAKLAAYFSKGRNHPSVPIDYTLRKYVKKAAGAVAGFVTYTNFQTVLIGLTREDVAQLSKEAGNALGSEKEG